VNFIARVNNADGPLKEAIVEVVSPVRGELVVIGTGKIVDGALDLKADPGPVWGLRIDGQPIVGVPVSFDGSTIDLGDIDLVRDGVPYRAFHAVNGLVYGLPRTIPSNTTIPLFSVRRALATNIVASPIGERTAIPIGDLFGNTAQQLDVAAKTVPLRFALAGATVTLKGVAGVSGDSVGLTLPNSETPPDGTPVSEVSFTIQPKSSAAAPSAQTAPAASAAPNLVGYTREFAMRKAAAAGFVCEVNNEIVATDLDAGRVVRQLPAAGSDVPRGGLIRLYVGKRGGS
jgi:hypothetical protein